MEQDLVEDLEIDLEPTRYEVGDQVVYPHHGAGKVLKKEMKEVLGENREYLTIKILHNDMTVMVPCCNADKAGLRRVIGEDDVKKVLSVLRDDVSQMPKNWNRRFKHNREKIKTGDVFELAEVVRNLAIRETEKGLSTGEKQMYTRAKKILASELMYALVMEEDEAETHLEELIAEAHASRNGAVATASSNPRPSSGPFPPAAAANALVPIGPRRSSFVPAGRCSSGVSRCCERFATGWSWRHLRRFCAPAGSRAVPRARPPFATRSRPRPRRRRWWCTTPPAHSCSVTWWNAASPCSSPEWTARSRRRE
jgi:CarD family transcriptional regulator